MQIFLSFFEGHNAYKYGGHPAPTGASPTQPYKCGQYVKVKTALILTLICVE